MRRISRLCSVISTGSARSRTLTREPGIRFWRWLLSSRIRRQDSALATVAATLRLSGHVLAQDKSQLAGQLLGRLRGDRDPVIHQFGETVKPGRTDAWLRPIAPTLTLPGGHLIRNLVGHTDIVMAVAIDAQGRRSVSGSDDRTVRVWDLSTGVCIATFTADAEIWSCAITPDGRTIAAGDQLGRVHFLRLEGRW